MKLVLKFIGLGILASLVVVTTALTARVLCSPEVIFLKLIWRALISA